MKFPLCAWAAALLVLAACHTQTSKPGTTEAATTADAPAAGQVAVANSPGTAYQVYRADSDNRSAY